MIKTVFLSSDYPSDEAIDNQINSWIAENPDIKLIDIKFQSNVSAVADSGVSAEYWHSSALIIYKVPSENNIRSINPKEKIKNNQNQLFPFWKQLKNQQAVHSCKTAN
nr:MAG TPA: Sporulation protein Cse60 [Caudoviricetes sp.]